VPLTYAAVRLEHALAGGQPGAVEFMVEVGSFGLIPRALVYGNHFARVAGDAVVGEEIRRVGKNQVNAIGGDSGQNFQAIALVNLEVVLGVVKDRRGQRIFDGRLLIFDFEILQAWGRDTLECGREACLRTQAAALHCDRVAVAGISKARAAAPALQEPSAICSRASAPVGIVDPRSVSCQGDP
jgi:hypothetical protein